MSYLVVPVRIDTFYTREGCTCVGPEVDFSQIPYFDEHKQVDINADKPYLTESVTAFPFQNDGLFLKPGLHLHWALPDMLISTRYGGGPTDFPVVPNRWCIIRDGSGASKTWIVESDFMSNAGGSDSCFVHTNPNKPNRRPFAALGRCLTLEKWKAETETERASYNYWKKEWGAGMTALGWGSPAFDTFYPNCRTAFGMYDAEIQSLTENLQYTIIGWYSDTSDDYFAQVSEAVRLESTAADNAETRMNRIAEILHLSMSGTATEGMLCYGKVKVVHKLAPPMPESEITVSVASSPMEAISALLASRETDKAIAEDQFEAILLGEKLSKVQLDLASKLNELRFERGFTGVESGWQWDVRLEDQRQQNETADTADLKANLPVMPRAGYTFLNALNDAQKRYDKAFFEYESHCNALYADWYRYIVCCYPPTGETEHFPDPDKIRLYIETQTLPEVARRKKHLGSLDLPPKDSNGKFVSYESFDATLAGDVKKAFNKLADWITRENLRLQVEEKQLRHWEAITTSAPRYWEANAPAVMLSARKTDGQLNPLTASQRFGLSDRTDTSTRLETAVFSGNFDRSPEGFSALALLRFIAGLPSDIKEEQVSEFGAQEDDVNSWHPFRVEWEMELYPLASQNALTTTSGLFKPDYLVNNYQLFENNPDFNVGAAIKTGLSISKLGQTYTGSAIISHKAKKEFQKIFTEFEGDLAKQTDKSSPSMEALHGAVQRALNFLDTNELMSFTPSGFNLAFLQQQQTMRLAPGDPIGMSNYREFTQKLKPYLPSGVGRSPSVLSSFQPIRAGALRINRLRIVDTFGRIYTINPSQVCTSSECTVPGQDEWIALSPRLCQPARANFRWLQADVPVEDTLAEADTHSKTGPICGWMISNLMDSSLMFYTANGTHIGDISAAGEWEFNKLNRISSIPVKDPLLSANPELKKVVEWIISQCKLPGQADFVTRFSDACLGALDNILPANRAGSKALTVLMGRPLAIVKAMVNLEIKGLPAFNQNFVEMAQDLKRQGRDTANYTQVSLPFRLGEYRQCNDSLVGYWSNDDAGNISNALFAINDSLSAVVNRTTIAPTNSRIQTPYPWSNWMKAKLAEWQARNPDGLSLQDYLLGLESGVVKKQDIIQCYPIDGGGVWDELIKAGWIQVNSTTSSIAHYSEANEHAQSIDAAPSVFTMLVEPHGKVHLTTGILPVKDISIPEESFADALKNMEINFLTAPLLTPRSILETSLPKEDGYAWSWLQTNKLKDGTISQSRTWEMYVQQQNFFEAYPLPERQAIWDEMVAKRWIVEDRTQPNIAIINPLVLKEKDLSVGTEASNTLRALLTKITTEGIQPFTDRAVFVGSLEIREGWLSLNKLNK